MGLFDKIKNAIFEEDEAEETEKKVSKKEIKTKQIEKSEQEKKEPTRISRQEKNADAYEETIVKKVDIAKTLETAKPEIKINDFSVPEPPTRKTPIIFDDNDFLADTREIDFSKTPTKEEKILYGGYEKKEEKKETKFRPSPIISPVYGVLNKNYVASHEENTNSHKSLDELFKDDSDKITLEDVRQKAYGDAIDKEYEDLKDEYEETPKKEKKPLLYDMEKDDTPGVEKVTLGDAEEYYNDLGLEYEVDYKDARKSNYTKGIDEQKPISRSTKNKELSLKVDAEMSESEPKELPKLKINRLKTAKEIKKAKVLSETSELDDDTPEEKNLYDLIDMMYDKDKKKE